MFLRALLAFLIVPVVVAGIVPFTIALCDPFKSTGSLAGRKKQNKSLTGFCAVFSIF
jgi:hypothetical protein